MSDVATVVVVSWNRADLLRRCLPAVRSQTLSGQRTFRTVVVDNGSEDDTLAVLADEFPWVDVVRNDRNLGFSGGNNAALRQVTTPFAVLLNNDAVPEPGWLEALLHVFDGEAGETVGVACGKILLLDDFERVRLSSRRFAPGNEDPRRLGVMVTSASVDGTDVLDDLSGDVYPVETGLRWTRPTATVLLPRGPSTSGAVELALTVPAGSVRTRIEHAGQVVEADVSPEPFVWRSEDGRSDVVHKINNTGGALRVDGAGVDRDYGRVDDDTVRPSEDLFFCCGNGMAIRTSVGQDVDWFDDAYFLYYEDADLCWRIRARGWRAVYVADAVIQHEHGASGSGNPDLVRFYSERNRLLCMITNADRSLAWQVVRSYLGDTARVFSSRARRRSDARVRRQVLVSLVRLAPHALRRRAVERRRATVARRDLQTLMVPLP